MRRALAPVLLALPLVGGCAMTFDATRLGVPVTMASSTEAPAQGQPFKVSSSSVYTLWGAVALKQASLEKALSTQLVGQREVRDLRIKVKSSIPQVILSVFTLGMVIPRTVQFEGVVPGEPVAPPGAPPAGTAPR